MPRVKRGCQESDEYAGPPPAPKRQAGNAKSRATGKRIAKPEFPEPRGLLKFLPEEQQGSNAFPYISNGDVFIILDKSDPKYQYRLESATLSRHSSIFARWLTRIDREYDQDLKDEHAKSAYRFELEKFESLDRWLLGRRSFTISPKEAMKPAVASRKISSIVPSVQIRGMDSKSTTLSSQLAIVLPQDVCQSENVKSNAADAENFHKEMGFPGLQQHSPGCQLITASDAAASCSGFLETQIVTSGLDSETSLPSIIEKREDKEDVIFIMERRTPELIVEPEARPPHDLCKAWDNVFRIFYNVTTTISSSDIEQAIKDCEALLQRAKAVEAENLVLPHVRLVFYQFGMELYRSISSQAVRFLELGFKLQSALIFREAMTHVVGNFDALDEKEFFTLNALPSSVKHLIQTKHLQLNRYMSDLNHNLFTTLIYTQGISVHLKQEKRDALETWVVVQIWQDFFRHHAGAVKGKMHIAAPLYRKLAKGGDAYLELDYVRAEIRALQLHLGPVHLKSPFDIVTHEKFPVRYFSGLVDLPFPKKEFSPTQNGIKSEETVVVGTFRDVASDLKLLKDFAKQEVKDICVNYSMLDVEAEGIEYFTCTKIDNAELPWVSDCSGNDKLV